MKVKDNYIPGENKLICDYSGFTMKTHEARRTWDGYIVRKDFWEPRHPQDFVKSRKENIKADLVRSEAPWQYENSSSTTFTEDFADNTGFSYDPIKAEFGGGQLQQILADTSIIVYGKYNEDVSLDYPSEAVDESSPDFYPSISDSKLLFDRNEENIAYELNLAPDIPDEQGCIRFRYTHDSDGAKLNYFIVTLWDSVPKQIVIVVNPDGTTNVELGGALAQTSIATGFSDDTQYTLELNWDYTDTQVARFFVDGTQKGVNFDLSGVAPGYEADYHTVTMEVAGDATLSDRRCAVDNLLVFNEVQHTSNYVDDPAADSSLMPTHEYSGVILPTMSYSVTGRHITSFDSITITESGNPTYILNGKWFNGSMWMDSDGTITKSSSATIVEREISSLPPSDTLQIIVFFPESRTVQSAVSNIEVGYTSTRILTASDF